MGKTLEDVLWELEYADKLDRKHAKKFVKVNDSFGEDTLEDCLRNGLNALEDFELSADEKLVKAYREMRTLEEHDFDNGNPVMKQFTDDDELVRILYADMSDALHAKATINFRTTMSLESAKFILIALARAVLDKSNVKTIMQDCGVSFEDYGRRKSLKKFIADSTEPIIKLRGKERERLDSLQARYGKKVGLKKYLYE
ncbi:MAG: hypothetical protein SR1Q7_11345 [Quinella sp. 1Q7]|nr:hypothetical protein [Quinella sp. 1Q7]